MGVGEWFKRRWRWTNPYADFEMRYATLKFFNDKAEEGFAVAFTHRLARRIRTVGFLLFAFEVAWLSKEFLQGDASNVDDTRLFHITMVRLGMDMLLGFVGLAMALGGCLQLRRPWLDARRFEGFVVVCLILLLGAIPFTEEFYVKNQGWPNADLDTATSAGSIMINLDCVVTVACLMPLRWATLWVLHVLAILWYPVLHASIIGMPVWGSYAALLLLIICSAIGKRDLEVQERRLFSTVAMERTLRASSEFQLSQSRQTQEPQQQAPSTVASLETGEIFNLGGGGDGTLSAEAMLARVCKVAEHEQWLIRSQEISIKASEAIGSGGFGAVVEASWSGLPVALKMSIEPVGSDVVKGMAALLSELRVLRKVRHPNIVLFLGSIIDPSMCEVALVLELVAGPNHTSFIRAANWGAGPLPDPCLYSMSTELVRALRYLHGNAPAIVHGDLKPSNVLVEYARSSKPRIKLVDFGLSRILSGKVRGLGGTFIWMAPESHEGDRCPTVSVDIYGIGRIMMYMMTRSEPFHGMARAEILNAIMNGNLPGNELPKESSVIYDEVWNVAEECVAVDASDRPSAPQICEQLQALFELDEFRESLGDLARELWGSAGATKGAGSGQLGGSSCGLGLESEEQASLAWNIAIPKIRKAILHQRSGAPSATPEAQLAASSQQQGSATRLPTIKEAQNTKASRSVATTTAASAKAVL